MHVLVAGAGISGVMTAYHLMQQGYQVTLMAKGPDPRIQSSENHHAATWNGAGARFVTALEGHVYTATSPLSPDADRAFRFPVYEGGWLGQALSAYHARERDWLAQRSRAYAHDKRIQDTEDYYLKNNLRALGLWHELIQQDPTLFAGADLHDQGVLRVYAHLDQAQSTLAYYRNHALAHQWLSTDQVAIRYPALAFACSHGRVAGVLEVEGLTFNVQTLARNLIEVLTSVAVDMHWLTEVRGFHRNIFGEVTGLITSRGTIVADSYVLNFGAYAPPGVLQGTAAHQCIGGVAGRWALCPQPIGWSGPVKLHGPACRYGPRFFPAYDLSLVPLRHPQTGVPYLAVGGGYVFLGEPPYQGKMEQAIVHFKEATELEPLTAVRYYNIGQTYSLIRNHKETDRYCDLAINLSPDWPQ